MSEAMVDESGHYGYVQVHYLSILKTLWYECVIMYSDFHIAFAMTHAVRYTRYDT